MLNCFVVGVGDFVGAVCRYLLGLIPASGSAPFPFITLLINLLGSFAIGVIAQTASQHNAEGSALALFLKVGVCGGFTTFSTFALESGDLMRSGKSWFAILYIVLSLVLCILGAFFGRAIAAKASC